MSSRDQAPERRKTHGTIASAWMRGVADLLAAEGLDAAALFKQASLDVQVLDRADGRFAVEQVDHLWALSEQHSGRPFIALSRPQADKPASFDVLAYAMMSCRNLAEAIERLVLYRDVVSNAVELRLTDIPGGQRLDILPLEPPAPGRALRLDYTIVTFLAFCRWVTCRNVTPLGVELSYPAPSDLSRHIAAFSCTPRFNAQHHAVLLKDEDLRLHLPTANEALSRLHDRVVRDYLQGMHPARIESRVADSLLRRFGQARVTRADVASELCMSDRTLQRRLADAGTTFQNEADSLRRQMAENYLRDPDLPLAGIAQLLGFAEESTFFRACHRWFGMSPGQYRSRQAN